MVELLTIDETGTQKPSPSKNAHSKALSSVEVQQRTQPSSSPSSARESLADLVKSSLLSAIGIHANGLDVRIEADSVIVAGEAPSFYIRQIIEHNSRLIIVDEFCKKFVPNVVVRS